MRTANIALTEFVRKLTTLALTKNVRKASDVIKANVLNKNVSLNGSFANLWALPSRGFTVEKNRNLDVQAIK